jgi:RNA polymerase sigma factor (sigma-70 family)
MRMPSSPETQLSLIVRLQTARDEAAWAEFLIVYEPLVLGLLRKNGLQDCDAQDVCQQVLAAVIRDIERWKPDGAAASFRRWLFQITRNRVTSFLGRPRLGTIALGGTDAQEMMAAQPDLHERLSDDIEQDYHQHLLLCAIGQVRSEFRDTTWQAFWQTCVDGRPVAEVAKELGMSMGNVYVARSRIMARLRTRVSQMQAEE